MKKTVIVISFLLTICAHAGEKEAKAAYSKKDYETAFKEYLPLAQAGDPKIQNQIGYMYQMGYGVPKDNSLTFDWFNKAAKQGYADAQYRLGSLYYFGEDVPKDKQKAFEWYGKAAAQGFAAAQNALGLMYDEGDSVPKNPKQAVEWYRKAANQGKKTSHFNLSQSYCSKNYVVPFHQEACYALLSLSAMNDESGISKAALDMYQKEMTTSEIEAGKKLASEMAKPNNFLVALDAFVSTHPESKK